MKIFNRITIILLFAILPSLSFAQVAGVVKQVVKAEAKQAAKIGMKHELKQAVKAETKQTVKAEMKQAAKAEAKQAFKAEIKQATKKEINDITKAETKQVVKAQVKQGVETETKQLAKEEAQIAKGGLKEGSFSSYKKKMTESSANYTSRTQGVGRTANSAIEAKGKSSIKSYTESANKEVVSRYASNLKLSTTQQDELVKEMSEEPGLANLIHENPKFNIERWLNARREVDLTKVERIAGRAVTNGSKYAGKNFYFNPYLNKDIGTKLKATGKYNASTLDQLIDLDKKYPNGIPFKENGYPDFVKAGACYKHNGKELIVTLDKFTGDRIKDNILANKYLESKGINIKTEGYTWHHLEGSPPSMVLVDADVHSVVKHSGGYSAAKIAGSNNTIL